VVPHELALSVQIIWFPIFVKNESFIDMAIMVKF
jgi:hypothetical protein